METKTYTIADLRHGKVALVNDGTIGELSEVIKSAFGVLYPNYAENEYIFKMGNKYVTSNKTTLQTQSVKVFYKQVLIEHLNAKKELNVLMAKKEIKVGDHIIGYKSKTHYTPDKYVGLIAEVIDVEVNMIQVKFGDNYTWWYDKHEAIEHLCNEDMGMLKETEDPLEDTPFHKPDFSHLLDKINPSHYKTKPKETIERIVDNLSLCEFKGYLKGNILKYLDRYQDKNGVEDLKKANWYLNKLIEIENEK